MTEQEYHLVQAKTIVWKARDMIGGTHVFEGLTAREKDLMQNAWNNLDRVKNSIDKRIKIEQAEEVKS